MPEKPPPAKPSHSALVQTSAAPPKAVAVITCDNEYKLFVNGRELAADDNWETVEVAPLESASNGGRTRSSSSEKMPVRVPMPRA